MTSLVIPEPIRRQMIQAAQQAMPLEACGLLAGRDRRVTRLYVLTNADRSPTHYSMIPAEQFAAVRDMRSRDLRLLAIWHSHPSAPARLSSEDLRLAVTPDVAYVTLSLLNSEAPDLQAFEVEAGQPKSIEVLSPDESD